MLKRLAQYFGVGLVTVLPIAFVIWLVVFVFNQVDSLFGNAVNWIDGVYVPGIGFLIVIVGITLVGAMARFYVSRQALELIDRLMSRIPFIKSLYTMSKEVVDNLLGKRKGFQRVVLVEWPPEMGTKVIGFVTAESLPIEIDPEGKMLSVYVPNAFQFAGPTFLVERDQVQDCSLTVDQALQFALSAGLGRAETKNAPIESPPKKKRRAEKVRTQSEEFQAQVEMDTTS
ncbi:DUF502 domain-containing protein [Alicyclobacillus sp. TC]|uniref:DUF502 domain-containing protein n=1 Tax=Alicyclobacillus sp. TC TaxID=2606450 RepID=UPI00193357EC|nr:DUF502 domain-containing protein [Alicyclobacillus sp. TC]QRF23440.1 DUF502 domain-containing protein [Alicyclobacillus sp. TC]